MATFAELVINASLQGDQQVASRLERLAGLVEKVEQTGNPFAGFTSGAARAEASAGGLASEVAATTQATVQAVSGFNAARDATIRLGDATEVVGRILEENRRRIVALADPSVVRAPHIVKGFDAMRDAVLRMGDATQVASGILDANRAALVRQMGVLVDGKNAYRQYTDATRANTLAHSRGVLEDERIAADAHLRAIARLRQRNADQASATATNEALIRHEQEVYARGVANEMSWTQKLNATWDSAIEANRRFDEQIQRNGQHMAGIRDQANKMNEAFDNKRGAGFGDSFNNANAAVTRLVRSVLALGAAMGVGLGVRELIQYSDNWKLIEGRLKLVTNSSAELASVQARLFRVAQETRTSYDSTANMYARVARNADQLGKSQEQLLVFTETVQKAILTSGATAGEASAGMLQLSQALASNTLRGDELRSVLENLPGVARALSQGLGVPLGTLRAMSEAGQLTGKTFVDAVLKMRDSVDRDFKAVPKTIGQAFQTLRNEVERFVAISDKMGGASKKIIEGLEWMRVHLPEIVGVIGGLATSWGVYVGLMKAVVVADLFGKIAVAIGLFVKAVRAGRDAVASFAIVTAALGGPLGIAKLATGLLAAAAGWAVYKKIVEDTTEALEKANEVSGSAPKTIPSLIQSVIQDAMKTGVMKPLAPQTSSALDPKIQERLDLSDLEVRQQRALQAAYGESALAIAKINAQYEIEKAYLQNKSEKLPEVQAHLNANAKALANLSVALVRADFGKWAEDQRKSVEESKAFTAATAQGAAALDNYTVKLAGAAAARIAYEKGGSAEEIATARRRAEENAMRDLVRRDVTASDQMAAQAVEARRKATEDLGKEIDKTLQKEHDASVKSTADTIKATLDARKAAKDYQDDMLRIAAKGIGKVLTDGFKSWQDFFDDVFRLFQNLMERMAKAGDQSTKGYKALNYGSAAIVGATSGYQTGNPAYGAISGAIAGNAIVPGAGAIVGALAGLGGGILGFAKNAREAHERFQEAQKQWQRAFEDFAAAAKGGATALESSLQNARRSYEDLLSRAQKQADTEQWADDQGLTESTAARDRLAELKRLFGDLNELLIGDFVRSLDAQLNTLKGNDFANTLAAIDKQYQDNLLSIQAAAAAYPGLINQQDASAKAAEIYALSIRKAREEHERAIQYQREDYEVRRLRATGHEAEADAMAFAQSQQREYTAAVLAGADAQTLAALAAALSAEKAQEAAKAIGSLNDSLTNIPSGFKLAKAIFDATIAGSPPPVTPGTDTYGPFVPQPYIPGGFNPTAPNPTPYGGDTFSPYPDKYSGRPSTQYSGPVDQSVSNDTVIYVDQLVVQSSAPNAEQVVEEVVTLLQRQSNRGGATRLGNIVRSTR